MRNVNSTIETLDAWMKEVNGGQQKTAGDTVESGAKSDTSYQDSSKAAPDNATSFEAGTTQTNLGKEHQQEAVNGGSNIEQQPQNADGADKKPTDDQGTNTLLVDESVKTKGNIGPIREQLINTAQKEAAADKQANHILATIEKNLQARHDKEAAAAAPAPAAEAPVATPAAPAFSKEATEYAQRQQLLFQMGMEKRAMDEAALAEMDPAILDAAGGSDAILDEAAATDPSTILPPELAAEGGAEGCATCGSPECPGCDGAAGAEGEGGDPEADAIFAELEQAGVTDDDIMQAMDVLAQMEESGVAPEELQQALLETEGEAAGAPVEKTASDLGLDPKRIEIIKGELMKVCYPSK